MRTWPSGSRAALLLASGLLLGSLATAQASDLRGALAQTTPQTPDHHGQMTDGSGAMGGHQMGGGPMGRGPMQGTGSPTGMPMDANRHYIEWMIPHHEDGVQMADLAPEQAEHPELRTLAAHISQVQTEEIGRMRQWYRGWYGTEVPPDTMAGGMMRMMGTHDAAPLDGARPFDKAFIEQMIPHHEMAVMGSTMALRMVTQPELRDLLQSIITSQSAEIAQMRAWYQQWYGTPVPETGMIGGHAMMSGAGGHPMGQMGGHQMGGATTDHPVGGSTTATDRQQMIHEHGASVMPFDLDQTLHHFQLLPDGGLQTVTANDPANQTQITLIQQHLTDLAQRFQQGDFSEPAALHGAAMPGLSDLAAAGSRLQVAYTALPDGAQLRFTAQDPTTLTALQRWFAAQLADHGSDAVAH
jgi:uncharacterized protein (DUF305 family)